MSSSLRWICEKRECRKRLGVLTAPTGFLINQAAFYNEFVWSCDPDDHHRAMWSWWTARELIGTLMIVVPSSLRSRTLVLRRPRATPFSCPKSSTQNDVSFPSNSLVRGICMLVNSSSSSNLRKIKKNLKNNEILWEKESFPLSSLNTILPHDNEGAPYRRLNGYKSVPYQLLPTKQLEFGNNLFSWSVQQWYTVLVRILVIAWKWVQL